MTGLSLLVAFTLAGAAIQAAPAGAGRGACDLLNAGDIRAVQQSGLARTKGSEETRSALVFAQCFFATEDYVRSVSLSVISGRAPAAARSYWNRTFRSQPQTAAPSKKKAPPRAIDGAGQEAFWTGDSRTGALYVLAGDVVLRVSVGGVADEGERIRRSKALAAAALRRLQPKMSDILLR